MKNLVGIRFNKCAKIYTFDAGDTPLSKGDLVIVNTENSLALGTVATNILSVASGEPPVNLKTVVRKATEEDIKIDKDNNLLKQEAKQFCLEKITERNLLMKLIDVEVFFDRSQIIFYFTAANRVDFRELVKDLVSKFKTRIELRQIGARQEARMVMGIGICGREVCCANFIQNLDRVSVKMAKDQSVSLNPEKISGLCGRLMCCLAFEFDAYQDIKKSMPKCGKQVQTEGGSGKVIRHNIIQGTVVVELEDGKEVVVKLSEL